MRKIIVFNLVTLDGFFEGLHHDISWHNVDAEFNEFAIKQLDSLSTLLFGRVTYELMASYWPTPDAVKDDPIVAGKMNAIPKIVFSTTMRTAEWEHTRVIAKNLKEEVRKLKREPGRDIAIFGSGNLIQTFIHLGLIDEYRLLVNPVVLGMGTPLFTRVENMLKLQLLNTKTFGNGNILLSYKSSSR